MYGDNWSLLILAQLGDRKHFLRLLVLLVLFILCTCILSLRAFERHICYRPFG